MKKGAPKQNTFNRLNTHSSTQVKDTKKNDTVYQSYPYGVQKQAVLKAFSGESKTMLQVAHEIGVKRTTICGYIGRFRKKGLIQEVFKDYCTISGYKAKYFKLFN